MSYPYAPGAKRDGTSAEAAAAMAGRARTLRERALAILKSRILGATADELAAAMSESVLAVRPRITELQEMGLIQATTARRRNVSGRSATVWIAVQEAAQGRLL